MLKAAGQTKSSAHTGATARVRPRGRQLGGTLFGLIVGLLTDLIVPLLPTPLSRSSPGCDAAALMRRATRDLAPSVSCSGSARR